MKRACGVAAAMAIEAVAVSMASAQQQTPPAPADTPSYIIPNIVALVMVAVVLAIACKRYRQG